MELVEHYLSLATKAIFIENILLAYFLGMCSFLAISKNIKASIGLGKAVIFVNTLTVPLNWFILKYLLKENALYSWTEIESLKGVDLSYLGLLIFIATIAASVQLVEMVIDRYSPSLYSSLGVFLPLITVNCAILGSTIFMRERSYNLLEATVFGFGSGLGWFLAIASMASIRYRLRYSNVPAKLRGLGITMLLTGLISMAFMAFSGIDL